MNILIAGGTGFIGSELAPSLQDNGHNVILWLHNTTPSSDLNCIRNLNEIRADQGIDVIISLAGSPINQLWTKSYKRKLIQSRIEPLSQIHQLIKRLKKKPQVMIVASAIGYYDLSSTAVADEKAQPGMSFSSTLCSEIESSALSLQEVDMRVCILRLGVVLGKNGGALPKMLNPFKFGLGAILGDGSQFFSWIHIQDVIRIMHFILSDINSTGVYNATAPFPITNKQFTKLAAKKLSRYAFFSIPSFIIKLLLGQMGRELLLAGRAVIPKRLMNENFTFRYPTFSEALDEILSKA